MKKIYFTIISTISILGSNLFPSIKHETNHRKNVNHNISNCISLKKAVTETSKTNLHIKLNTPQSPKKLSKGLPLPSAKDADVFVGIVLGSAVIAIATGFILFGIIFGTSRVLRTTGWLVREASIEKFNSVALFSGVIAGAGTFVILSTSCSVAYGITL